jgi:hypothetical protein
VSSAPVRASGREILHVRLAFEDARPPAEDVCTVLGYAPGAAPASVRETVSALLACDDGLWSIEGGGAFYPAAAVDLEERRLVVDGVTLDIGRTVAGQLARAEGVLVFLCTAGPGIEERSRRLMAEGDPFTGFIADAVGSLVVDAAMDRVHDCVEALAGARGLRVTNRYSPGYCGWHVSQQQQLFRLLPAGFCGVSLSESSLMKPIKTVSGVIGLGSDARRNPYTCRLCDLGDCLYRRLQPTA